jgi:hypothetical protein
METNLDIIYLTQQYIKAKGELDTIEREYELKKAHIYLSASIQAFGNAPSRDSAATIQMEQDNHDLCERLYNARGEARKYFYLREAVLDTHKDKRSES